MNAATASAAEAPPSAPRLAADDRTDLTEAQRVMEQLADQRAFLRQIIDLNPCFIFAKDREGRFTLVNQAVADAYGTTVENLTGRTDAEFNPNPDEVAHFRRIDLQVMDSKQEKIIPEEAITDASGHVRILQTIKRPIVGLDGRANQVLGVSTDITARKALEDRLAQAEKLEAIGRLAGGVAHDFNNLLTVILGSIEVLRAELEPGHPLHPSAAQIQTAAERAATLTRQLVAFSRKQVLRPRVIDINRIATESTQMLRRLIGENVELVTQLRAHHPFVKADPAQITQVILNLAINSRDAMPNGGRLTLGTSNVVVDAKATYSDTPPGSYVAIEITDTGAGISPELLPHLFEPFFTTKAPGRGTGLGLAMSYGTVRQSGGHIALSTEVGRGTTFYVYLPQTDEPEEPVLTPPADASSGHETILLAEDEPMVRWVATAALRQAGYLVLEASHGIEALAVAARHAGPIHLLVTDVIMPHMGGIELAKQLSRLRPEMQVLYTSGYTEKFAAGRGGEPGVEFLAKPYVPNVLARRVRELLDARTGKGVR